MFDCATDAADEVVPCLGVVPLTILHTNDFHGKLDAETAARIAAIKRAHAPALYFDCGDMVRTGNLGIALRPDPGWPLLELAGCDASVPGNRESQLSAKLMRAKLKGASHPMLCANLALKSGKPLLPPSVLLTVEVDGSPMRVGVVGVMVPMVTRRMASAAVSELIWEPPLEAAIRVGERLRSEVDLLIALTHIGYRNDVELAQATRCFDVILGGHSHTVLNHPEIVGNTWIAHGGSHGRFLGVYIWDGEALSGNLETLRQS